MLPIKANLRQIDRQATEVFRDNSTPQSLETLKFVNIAYASFYSVALQMAPKMKYTNLGSSGLRVSRICVGCMSFGDRRGRHSWVNFVRTL